MTDQDRRRDLSKLRTVPLDDATHRRLRLHCHGLREDGEAGEVLARVAAEAVNAWIDARERDAMGAATYVIDPGRLEVERAARQAMAVYAEHEAMPDCDCPGCRAVRGSR